MAKKYKTDEKTSDATNAPESPKKDEYEGLALQVQSEYKLGWDHQKPEKDEWEVRLKLYNNQRRDKEAVGDTTMFTIHQTVLASLYDDRLMVSFAGRVSGDEETANNVNSMAEYDYDEMRKDQLDYDWDWDVGFFGWGLVALEEFVRDAKNNVFVPMPEVLDPITWIRDPRATSVNGDQNGKGAMRFGGYETKMSEEAISKNTDIFYKDFKEIKIGSGTMSLLQDAIDGRNQAQGLDAKSRFEKELSLGCNAEYDITIWYTHYKIDGKVKKVKVWLANERSKVIGVKVLKHNYFPITKRDLYKSSHTWSSVSIPDITEDKQRARAAITNIILKTAKADLEPMYVYDSNKITNRNDLSFDFNKFIPVDGKGENLNTAIMPMNKANPNIQLASFILDTIDASAQKATATPDMQQGIQSQKDRPLGETNILASKVDTRYSLSAKVFGWSDREFWRQWFQMYDDYFADKIDEKVLRINGAFGAKWRPLTRKDIIPKIALDVKIESKAVNRSRELEERNNLTQYFTLALQEPTANRRWGLKKLAGLNGLEKDEVDRLFPPTIDERIAEDENELLNKNKFVEVKPEDDHNVHLEMHAKAAETDSTYAHIETHKEALSIKKVNPEFFPQDQGAAQFQEPGSPNTLPVPQMMPTQGIAPSQTSNQVR